VIDGFGGIATESSSLFQCESGTNANGFGSISTVDRLVFRPGQGEKDLFSARFSAGAVNSEQFAGLINANAALGFGYNGDELGIILRHGGTVEIQELTITTAAGGGENATITVDGTGYTVPLTSGTVQHNADEVATSLNAQVSFWSFQAVDDQVVAVALIAQVIAGAFAFTSATAVAAWAQIAAGVQPIDEWTNQADWSEDAMDGSGTDTVLDPAKLNSYKIQVGPSLAFFSILDAATNKYLCVHVINANNASATVPIENPTFSHTWYALNRGGTTSVMTEGVYSGLYREGPDTVLNPDASIQASLSSVSTTPIPIISLKGRGSIDDVINLSNALMRAVSVTSDSAKTIIVTLIRGGTLTSPVFQYVDKANSILEVDTSATAVTGGDQIQLAGLNVVDFLDLITPIRRNETITIAVNVSANPASDFLATVAYAEDL
jgi:hypothetical protein